MFNFSLGSDKKNNYVYPFNAFNFSIEINVKGVAARVCDAAFSECDGLDMTMEIKSIREGGSNNRQIRLAGPVAYGNVTLKRGLTSNADLWKWFDSMMTQPQLRADAYIVVMGADQKERLRYLLKRCIPVKLKAPGLNAKDGMLAIEEFQMADETLTVQPKGR